MPQLRQRSLTILLTAQTSRAALTKQSIKHATGRALSSYVRARLFVYTHIYVCARSRSRRPLDEEVIMFNCILRHLPSFAVNCNCPTVEHGGGEHRERFGVSVVATRKPIFHIWTRDISFQTPISRRRIKCQSAAYLSPRYLQATNAVVSNYEVYR